VHDLGGVEDRWRGAVLGDSAAREAAGGELEGQEERDGAGGALAPGRVPKVLGDRQKRRYQVARRFRV
jgi:hypothetical protein